MLPYLDFYRQDCKRADPGNVDRHPERVFAALKLWKWQELNGDRDDMIDPYLREKQIVKESEKALLIKFYCNTHSRRKCFDMDLWVPRSLLQTPEELEAEYSAAEDRIQARLDDHMKLWDWAKAQGIKGLRQRTTRNTLLCAIRREGLQPPAELEHYWRAEWDLILKEAEDAKERFARREQDGDEDDCLV